MPPSVRPRGPLPARVYWTRRILVLGVPLLLVAVLARVLGGSADGRDAPQASRAAATTQDEPVVTPGATAPTTETSRKGRKNKSAAPPTPVLAEPDGPCTASDIVATAAVEKMPGFSPYALPVTLRTIASPACTWTVSPDTLAVTITSGKDFIWSTRQCPAAIKTQDVVVRQAVDTTVEVTWHSRRSDEDCSRYTDYAQLGYYHAQAAALGGEATDVQFRLVAPAAPVVTRTITPKAQKTAKSGGDTRDFKPGEGGEGNSEG